MLCFASSCGFREAIDNDMKVRTDCIYMHTEGLFSIIRGFRHSLEVLAKVSVGRGRPYVKSDVSFLSSAETFLGWIYLL